MTEGVLLFARNNQAIDYNKMAYYCALRVKKHLNLPVSIVTDSKDWLLKSIPDSVNVFDKIIDTYSTNKVDDTIILKRRLFDGSLTSNKVEFKNNLRTHSYSITPYKKTLVLDTDYLIANDNLLKCFDSNHDFLIYKNSYDVSGFRKIPDFDYLDDKGIEFFWATVLYFEKTEFTQILFNLCKHIQDHWHYYRNLYGITHSALLRNDYVFSIAIHILRGYSQTTSWPQQPPGKMYYTLDKDILENINQDSFTFLVEKENHLGEYTLRNTQDMNVHVMNKASLIRKIDKELNE